VISAAVRDALARELGAEPTDATPLSGGSINDAYAVSLDDGRRVFVKENAGADSTMFPTEARGLEWLRAAGAIRVPEVLAVAGDPGFIALELIESSRRAGDFCERLGRQLAALHRAEPDGFGLDHDNFIGRLPQSNRPAESWAEFYARERIGPQMDMACDAGLLSGSDRQELEALMAKLPELVGDPEPAARLHGDLWGGNLHVGESGEPCLIDPAVFGGHREMDLAMMQLFGGFDRRVFAAYDEAYPLQPEWRDRISLYQLYYLLVHVNLFGSGYLGQTRSAMRRYL
jgi:fructosamine-3-kinase